MDPQTVNLVQTSFQKVIPIADLAMKIFYTKLFEIDPSLQNLFPTGEEQMGKQRNKLRDMLVVAVNSLSKPEVLIPALQNLGRRHVGYGVAAEHYNTVGQALIDTLAAGLGDDFTPEVKTAWGEVYGLIATTMIEAGNEVAA
ncbi:globin family protein [Flavilitoribacter nigricans]|uniref:Hemin receptor n=1 Tax=Flavilitoribacter nigricans (strain ATCC 23147 / DSM 23189 / NBRC 102662 / NCIMB 1420 / SS-2) TaxID=1122177 RepID=A0A2D0NFV7_FLAN2|nr:globin family protein [Flavilitoribacter nigricans]PHN07270.1 hemin receptor [Flavilitoribacter nigricans DSM 23189 = NBRC 102662]